MNTTRFTLKTDSATLISKLKEDGVPVMDTGDNEYEIVIGVHLETKLCDLIEDLAKELKATVDAYIFYQDPGTGEPDYGYIHIVN